ncbi:hypothetical protein PBAL39_18919 [Pedobacter sp. BAL39]|nr:hypothetical protein PBAL39_18919 [Pedobacter sp. BAL39]
MWNNNHVMRKIYLFLTLSILTLASCKKSENADPLIKRWYIYEVERISIYSDGRPNESSVTPTDDPREFMEFKSDGTLDSYVGTGTYARKNDVLELRVGTDFVSYRYTLTADRLELNKAEKVDSHDMQTIFRLKQP